MCTVGSTTLTDLERCLQDLQVILSAAADWVRLGRADEQKLAWKGTVEAWARSEANPVAGWYGQKPDLRGRFAMYIPPLMEFPGLANLEHKPRHIRIRAR